MAPDSVNGLNLYVYANNDPVNTLICKSTVNFADVDALTSPASLSFNLPALPKWTEYATLALDIFSSVASALETAIWGLSADGKAFSDFHYAAYGINRFTSLDELSSPLGRACRRIGKVLIAADFGISIYNSIQQGYSFTQGATSLGLTAARDLGIYFASQAATKIVGTWAGGKLGGALGAAAGPVGIVLGVIAGMAVGYIIDEIGNMVIAWVEGLYD